MCRITFFFAVSAVASAFAAPRLDVVYPPAGSSLPVGSQTYVIGSVTPADAPVTCDGKPVKVYRTGGFLFMYPLREAGKAVLRFESGATRLDHSFLVKSEPRPRPNRITPVSPLHAVGILPGESFLLACDAPAGRKVFAMVGERTIALAPSATKPGRYEASIQFKDGAECVPVLFWSDGLPDAPGGTITARASWPVYTVKGKLFETRTRSLPNDGDTVGFPKPGFTFRSNGFDGENVRARFGNANQYILRSALTSAKKGAKVSNVLPDLGAAYPARPAPGKRPRDLLIVVDPGHGGQDTGAFGPRRKTEKEANLSQAKLVAQALRAEGFKVCMTRTKDEFVGLYERAKLAYDKRAAAFVSIHHNATAFSSDPSKARSVATFAWNERGRVLAGYIQKQIGPVAAIPDRGVQEKSLAVCRNPAVPSCLLEFDFINCPEGEEAIFNEARQKRFAAAVAAGVKAWACRLTIGGK
ncbi:MAG: N-acetylmuramoyl-L-alanine amidase [Kiritimatiellae bacterium]|nr:N-acetylmuramoyl-L-alanine amidase [Kiritimatiellia bacterium]